ncbi:alpha/beta hydrolase [Marivirga sp. S37H4]|uniref:Alpha/beta hydrolase n=1 Tax=Marivirga aurantiaca TaxID=2802615 RepID=A0A934X1D8_9BACT|nr:alpha/beta hydrolase [Marivirga aurantiaca]MBK6266702.1 alpha/beta hydrolase [Marivirga aurantiaca]
MKNILCKNSNAQRWTALLVALLFATGVLGQNNYSFKVEKSGQGKPLIFIPGLISGGDVWDGTVAHFSKNYECHVLTLAGFAGQAPIESPPYLETYKEDIIRYIKSNSLTEVSLVGHSIGGYLSMMIGLEQDSAIQQLIIVDALPFFSLTFNPNAKEGFDQASADQYIENFKAYNQEQIDSYRRMTAKGMITDSIYWDKVVQWAKSSDLKTEAYCSHEMMATDLRDKLANMKTPMLVLAAWQKTEMYPNYTLEYAQQIYNSQYEKAPNCQVVVAEDSKHFIMYDQPDWLYSQMENFLLNPSK